MDDCTEVRSVLVSHTTGKPTIGDAFGTSGIELAPGWILAHGSLLSPSIFGGSAPELESFLDNARMDLEKDLVVVPLKLAKTLPFRLQYHSRTSRCDRESNRGVEQRIVEEKNCMLKLVWRCSLLCRTFNDQLFSWSFDKIAKFDKSLLSIFLILRVDDYAEDNDDVAEGRRVLSDFYRRHLEYWSLPKRGLTVEIESAPFGNAVFLDSVSRGLVSNVFGRRDCVILTDANAVPGCEGAPLFIVDQPRRLRRICGQVIAPLSWCRGEWVDYTFAANLRPCLEKILRATDKGVAELMLLTSPNERYRDTRTEILLPDLLDRSVVVVKCGSGWGTGVVVDVPTGTILTCSHVVHEAIPNSRVTIVLTDADDGVEVQTWARLTYKTRAGQPYDVAVLKLEQRHEGLKALTLAPQLPDKGTTVMTAGFPFFGAAPASYSRGIVSRLTSCMLQTTCCVQSGASGGPVVSCLPTAENTMLGMIVSNAVSANGNSTALYPRFNMAVPSTVIREPLMRYIRTGDVTYLESLSSSDPIVQETWNFYLTPRSKM